MKKYLIPALALMGIMASCSKSDNEELEGNNDPAEIRMASGVSASSRAAVNSDASNHPTADLNVYFIRPDDATAANKATAWGAVGTAPQTDGISKGILGGVVSTAGAVTFKKIDTSGSHQAVAHNQYYNSNNDLESYFVGFYPWGTLGTGTNGTTVTWSIDGKTDILVSNYVSGSKSTASTNLTPQFDHKLTWLVFNVIAQDAHSATTWGSIKSVTIQAVKSSASVEFDGTSSNFAFGSTNANISTCGLNTNWDAPTALAIPSGTAANFSQALVEPKDEYLVTVVTQKGTEDAVNHSNIPVTFAGGVSALAGSKHAVTLTFNLKGITATATVIKWADGISGSGTVD